MLRRQRLLHRFASSRRHPTQARSAALRLTVHHRRLLCEHLEDRRLLSATPLNVALVSDAVAQAEQVRKAAAKDTIPIVYQSDGMPTAGLADLLELVSVAHGGSRIAHLGIVAHGASGQVHILNAGQEVQR